MKRHHAHIALLLFAVGLVLMTAALYAYLFYATERSVQQAGLARDIVRVEQADQSQAQSLSDTASSTASDRARLSSFFVPSDNVVAFITTLESIGSQSGSSASISSLNEDSVSGVKLGSILSVEAAMDVHGSWSSVMRALALAERLPYAVSIDHVTLNSSGSGPAAAHDGLWSLSFQIHAAVLVTGSSSS